MTDEHLVDLAPFGLAVGHATDEEGATGLTVVRGVDGPFRAAAAIVGRATGTRDFGPLDPGHLVERVDAILLTGGSAYGLDAAAGVMRWLEERGRGFDVGVGVVPIVPAAVIFDLAPLGRPDRRPTPAMAYAAADAASPRGIAEGSVGAGTGATVGKALGPAWAMKGGVGVARSALGSRRSADAGAVAEGREPTAESPPLAAAALVVVNAFGDVRDATGRILAGARDPAGGFADATAVIRAGAAAGRFSPAPGPRSTTLALVALDGPLSRLALRAVASAAAAALHRRITPAGTSFDGDVVFATSPLDAAGAAPVMLAPAELLAAEVLAAAALEAAVERAVRMARGRDGVPGLADHHPPGH